MSVFGMIAQMARFFLPILLIYYFIRKLQEIRLRRIEESINAGVVDSAGNPAQINPTFVQQQTTIVPVDPNDLPPPAYTEKDETASRDVNVPPPYVAAAAAV